MRGLTANDAAELVVGVMAVGEWVWATFIGARWGSWTMLVGWRYWATCGESTLFTSGDCMGWTTTPCPSVEKISGAAGVCWARDTCCESASTLLPATIASLHNTAVLRKLDPTTCLSGPPRVEGEDWEDGSCCKYVWEGSIWFCR